MPILKCDYCNFTTSYDKVYTFHTEVCIYTKYKKLGYPDMENNSIDMILQSIVTLLSPSGQYPINTDRILKKILYKKSKDPYNTLNLSDLYAIIKETKKVQLSKSELIFIIADYCNVSITTVKNIQFAFDECKVNIKNKINI